MGGREDRPGLEAEQIPPLAVCYRTIVIVICITRPPDVIRATYTPLANPEPSNTTLWLPRGVGPSSSLATSRPRRS